MVKAPVKPYWWPSLSPRRSRLLPNLRHLRQFQGASLYNNRTSKAFAYKLLGERVGIDNMGPLPLTKKGDIYQL